MKKLQAIVLGLIFVTGLSCKQAKKEKEEMKSAQTYGIVEDSTTVRFTAYKTMDKKPVGGTFTKVDLKYTEAETPMETLDGLEFSIPVSSLFTNDTTNTRDPKIIHFFFNVMAQTSSITGVFNFDDDKNCSVNLSMNGISEQLPLEYEVTNGTHINFTGVMDLKKWNALEALASLNKACEQLHTGPDGVSKTWEDVAINASIVLKKSE
ncbi:MAG: hypothetical protein ABJN84_00820 [Flavobacteriaceae bacterium]